VKKIKITFNEMELDYLKDALQNHTDMMKAETIKKEAEAQESGRHYIFHPNFWDGFQNDILMKLKIK
jgi:hypothetical protein